MRVVVFFPILGISIFSASQEYHFHKAVPEESHSQQSLQAYDHVYTHTGHEIAVRVVDIPLLPVAEKLSAYERHYFLAEDYERKRTEYRFEPVNAVVCRCRSPESDQTTYALS